MSRTKKFVTESTVEMTYLALPSDANTIGTVFGGRILHLMDTAAAIAARRHSCLRVVTVGVDGVRFLQPIRVGQVITLLASVNHGFCTSMEVGLKVIAEDTYEQKRFHAASAYFTLVGMDENSKIQTVPEIQATTEDEKRRSCDAAQRRERRQRAFKK
jgi:acyl-CoA hydrolase